MVPDFGELALVGNAVFDAAVACPQPAVDRSHRLSHVNMKTLTTIGLKRIAAQVMMDGHLPTPVAASRATASVPKPLAVAPENPALKFPLTWSAPALSF